MVSFVVAQCMELGFLNKPTAIAYDNKLQLLAVGNKAGDIRMYPFSSACMHSMLLYNLIMLYY